MSAGQRAKGMALDHSGKVGQVKGASRITSGRDTRVDTASGSVIARSSDGQRSLGIGAAKSAGNEGAALGYRFNGEKTSGAAALHTQTSGKRGVAEHGGFVGVEHRFNDNGKVFGSASHSITTAPGRPSMTNTKVDAGAGFKVGDASAVTAAGHRSFSSPGGITERGGSLKLDHSFDKAHSASLGLAQSKVDFPGNLSRNDTTVDGSYRYDMGHGSSLSAGGHRTVSRMGTEKMVDHGGFLGVGSNKHSTSVSMSQSKYDSPWSQGRSDTTVGASHSFNINDSSALSASVYRSISDYGNNSRDVNHGFNFGYRLKF